MKRIVLSLAMVAALVLSAAAQKKTSPLAGLGGMIFYGIDFSKGRVYGAADEPESCAKRSVTSICCSLWNQRNTM
jgi:hypothetical protein